ncbi:MAG: choice-of-anchor X domain-containing protein [Gemmataceae bacterium]
MSLIPMLAGCLAFVSAEVGDIRQVRHEPVQPKPNVPVVVTAKAAAGTEKVTLKLQAVAPGKYIRKADPAYEKDWLDLPMRDDGLEGDTKANDGIYTVRVPALYQKHRWLIRYRIVAADKAGKLTKAPEADDACPNLAWWCDAGPTAWTGTRDPGKTPPLTFSSEFLGTLQTLHLIAKADDVARSQWDGGAHRQKQQGTIIYKGVVYDHIQFSNRGQGSAHISGKNKWGLKFNKGHAVPFEDHAGVRFPDSIKSLNLNPGGSTPYLPILRGITGLDEVMSLRAYRLAGVPTPPATWVQWRVVQDAVEVDEKNQYRADLWGPYVAIGEMDPHILADKKLPDGLTVSIQSGIKHVPRGMEEAQAPKVWEQFINNARGNPKEDWWRANLDLPSYYSFHALNRLLGNVDIRPDGNHGYYRFPDGHWAPIPWDTDMMFVPRHHQPGHIDAVRCLSHPAITLEYRNRAREILDLFAGDASENGGQVGQFTADLAAGLTPKGYQVSWPKLDEAMWNQHPRSNQRGSFYVNPARGDHFGGPWNRVLATNDFAGFVKYLVDFCTDSRATKKYAPNDGNPRGYGWGYLDHEAKDERIPAMPKVQRIGQTMQFQGSAFASPAKAKSAALEWRVGRVGQPGWYELTEHWRKEAVSGTDIEIPATVFAERGEYRIRARWRDDTGRCSHWSLPVTVSK